MADLQAPAAPGPGGADVADVFLSYSRADKDSVLRVQAQLKDAGLQTFLDRDQLAAGQPWSRASRAPPRLPSSSAPLGSAPGSSARSSSPSTARPRRSGRGAPSRSSRFS